MILGVSVSQFFVEIGSAVKAADVDATSHKTKTVARVILRMRVDKGT